MKLTAYKRPTRTEARAILEGFAPLVKGSTLAPDSAPMLKFKSRSDAVASLAAQGFSQEHGVSPLWHREALALFLGPRGIIVAHNGLQTVDVPQGLTVSSVNESGTSGTEARFLSTMAPVVAAFKAQGATFLRGGMFYAHLEVASELGPIEIYVEEFAGSRTSAAVRFQP